MRERLKDICRFIGACIIMVPITIFVFVAGFLFYMIVPEPKEGGGAGGGYCDHFDDL